MRVLKPSGIYFVVSYGRPENRTFHFEREHLDIELKQLVLYPDSCKTEEEKNEKSHFIYICKKGENSKNALENWEKVKEELENTECDED